MIEIALDFDGVLHSDIQGSAGNYIPDPPVPGAMEKLKEFIECPQISRIHIFSLRCYENVKDISEWVVREFQSAGGNIDTLAEKVTFTVTKPQVTVLIDDRALCFMGDWADPRFSIENILNFSPWNRHDVVPVVAVQSEEEVV